MRNIQYIFQILVLVFFAGCVNSALSGHGISTSGTGYNSNKDSAKIIYKAPFMETWDTTLKVLEDMNLIIQTKTHDSTTGKIAAVLENNNTLTIFFQYRVSNETEVNIWTGSASDRDIIEALKERIGQELF
jgi:hypothetical protein